MDITVSEKYLWFPVDMSGEMVWVSVYDGDQKIQEMKVSLGKEHIDFYGVWKATEYLGKELRIVSEKGEEYLDGVDIRQEETRPQNDYPYRPRLHYTPAYGWVNDPNGLDVYKRQDLYGVIFPSGLSTAISGKMLDTAAHLPILFHIVALKAMDLRRCKSAVQIWILAGGFHDAPPTRVADEVDHRREDDVDSCGR